MEAKYLDDERINAASREGRRNGQTTLGEDREHSAGPDGPALRDRVLLEDGGQDQKRRASIHMVDARRVSNLQAGRRHPLLHQMGHSGQFQTRHRVRRIQDPLPDRLGQDGPRHGRSQNTVRAQARADLVGRQGAVRVPRRSPDERTQRPQAERKEPHTPNRETRRADASAAPGNNAAGRPGCRSILWNRRNRRSVRTQRASFLRH